MQFKAVSRKWLGQVIRYLVSSSDCSYENRLVTNFVTEVMTLGAFENLFDSNIWLPKVLNGVLMTSMTWSMQISSLFLN